MAVAKFLKLRKPRAVYLTHWIFELRLSLVALVMRCLKYVSRFGNRDLSILAFLMIGFRRLCVAHRYHQLKCCWAAALLREAQKSIPCSFSAQARAVCSLLSRNSRNSLHCFRSKLSGFRSQSYFVPTRRLSSFARNTLFSARRTWSTASPKCFAT